jgi:antitoxin (DNA-binding transcriptional repressor) of toxin-antitoxin stability system
MSTFTIDDVRRNPAAFLDAVERGEPATLLCGDRTVAEVRPVPVSPTKKRPIGLCKGEFVVPDDFDAPLPDDILKDFYGE